MRKAGAFFLLSLLMWAPGALVFAQEEEYPDEEPGIEEEAPVEPDWEVYIPNLYSSGDRVFSISMGLIFPTVFTHQGKAITHNVNPLGGTGNLAYMQFIGSHVFLGGEIGIMFASTLRKSSLYIVPIGFRAGYQFIVKRFEFPLSLALGIAPQSYLSQDYLGFFMKPSGGAYFRLNPDWSFGINTAWWWVPQWPKEKDKIVNVNFIDITFSARYHF
jgi:hypothetical protein